MELLASTRIDSGSRSPTPLDLGTPVESEYELPATPARSRSSTACERFGTPTPPKGMGVWELASAMSGGAHEFSTGALRNRRSSFEGTAVPSLEPVDRGKGAYQYLTAAFLLECFMQVRFLDDGF